MRVLDPILSVLLVPLVAVVIIIGAILGLLVEAVERLVGLPPEAK